MEESNRLEQLLALLRETLIRRIARDHATAVANGLPTIGKKLHFEISF